VYAHAGDLVLGEGETVRGGEYTFAAPFNGDSRSQSRPLVSYAGGFNSNRWVLGAGGEVVYRHRIGDRRQTAAEVSVSVTWHAAGELAVEASADGKAWQPLGTIGKVAGGTFKVPEALLPAAEIWVRLRTQDKGAFAFVRQRSPSLQVGAYGYRATIMGEPTTAVGATHFVAVRKTDPRLEVTVEDLGDGLPGANNVIVARVRNVTQETVNIPQQVTIAKTTSEASKAAVERGSARIGPGEHVIRVPYAVAGAGTYRLGIELGETPGFSAEASLSVADLYDSSYGESLPASGVKAGLWWCPSGWKISQTRPAPEVKGEAVLIRAAKNETEAAQVVVRPSEALRGLTAKAEALAGPGGAVIPAECIEVLRVRYVMVTQPTDSTGTVAPWPDPLPPLRAPLDLEAGRNQPLWVRVKVPRDAKAGKYEGRIHLAAKDWSAEVPLRVEVYDFTLPDRMTCQTAFGFSPANVWRYQKLEKPEDRRAVIEKYLADMSAHHIAPYDPAPLDPLKVTWPKKKGGTPEEEKGLVPAFDWSRWDAAIDRALGEYHFNTFMVHVPGMGGGTYQKRENPELHGYKEDAPEYKTAFTNYARALESHLRAKAWLREAYIYWFDEPDRKDYAFVMNGFRKLKAAAPDLRRMLTEQVEPELVGGPNLWCPVSSNYDHARAEERRRAGEEFWWYVCCGPKAPYCGLFIDHPATELRVWLWQTWQRKIDGILVWEMTYWTSSAAYPDKAHPQNPYEDPMGWVSDYDTAKGVRQAWGNGDGRFLYPPEAAADASPVQPVLEGPVDSIRWEMLRDGIEDYEYMVILRRLVAERGAKLPAEEKARFAALLEVPPEITKDMTTFTRDPAPIEKRRDAVARAIEELHRR
jgi:hypothetical protein